MSKDVKDIIEASKNEVGETNELAVKKAELLDLELQLKRLEAKEKAASLQDIEERLAERELKRETKRQRSLTNGETLKQLKQNDESAQKRCNHRKGGNGPYGVIGGKGDGEFAVLKHTFANGDTWVRCLRCGRTWKPPVRSLFANEEAYLTEKLAYQNALEFQTRNVPSASIQFRFSDNGEYYRQVTANSTLR